MFRMINRVSCPKVVKKVAYFLSESCHFGRPFDDAIIRSLNMLGYNIDIYVPGQAMDCEENYKIENNVTIKKIHYNFEWLLSNLLKSKWSEYRFFLAACNLPVPFAYFLSKMNSVKFIVACDEIYSLRISPAVSHWEKLAKFGMRHAAATIITDLCRKDLQIEYAGINREKHIFVENPCCYSDFPFDQVSKSDIRDSLGISKDLNLVSYTGSFNDAGGAHDFLSLLDLSNDLSLGFLIQTGGDHSKNQEAFIEILKKKYPVFFFGKRTTYQDSLKITSVADIGFVSYHQKAPQFQQMGFSSQKLCNHMLLGQPVVSLTQPSFEAIRDCKAGILYNSIESLHSGVRDILKNYEEYARGTKRCFDSFIRPQFRIKNLSRFFLEIDKFH